MTKSTQKSAQTIDREGLSRIEAPRPPRAGRAMAVGAGALLVVELLAACAPSNTGVEATKPPKPLSQEQLIQQNLENRPEVGSPEYDERVTDRLRIPFVPGQDPADVVFGLNTSVHNYIEMGFEDAPQSQADVNQWQVDTNKSLSDLATELNLAYFDPGFRKAVFGPAAEGEFADRIVTNYAPSHVDSVAALAIGAIKPGADPLSFDPGITSASENRITGSSAATYSGKINALIELPYELVASDDNGNGVLDEGDSWYWAGTGQ